MKIAIALFAQAVFAQTYTIHTVAGWFAGTGDGGSATSAILENPCSVTLDSAGNLFIADYGNESVRRVDAATGIITTVNVTRLGVFDMKTDTAGNIYIAQDEEILKLTPDGAQIVIADANRTGGYNGDEIPAISAAITFPDALALDPAGNIYFPDRDNQRIRQITPDGIIHTIAGTGQAGYNGDEIPATSAQLNRPVGLALDAVGNLYIADENNRRIRQITPDGIIHTIAGNGTSHYNGDGGPAVNAALATPVGVQVDAAGNLYITDAPRIRKITPDGIIRTIVGNNTYTFNGDGIPALAAGIDPRNVTADAAGNLYIADYTNSLVRMVGPDGTISTVAGSLNFGGDGGPAAVAQFSMPYGLAIDLAGNMFVADTYNHRVRKIDPTGTVTTYAGTGMLDSSSASSGPATQVSVGNPMGLASDASGNLYVSNNWKCRIDLVTPDGVLQSIAGNTCGYGGDGGPASAAQLQNPQGLVLDPAGNLFIADTDNNRVRKITPDGIITTVAGIGVEGAGADGIAATQSALHHPQGLAIDAAGNLYIADYGSNRVRKVDPNGIITTVAGNGKMGGAIDGKTATSQPVNEPTGIAIDAAGNLYITEFNAYYIRKVNTSGILSTIAGTGTWSYSGDGGPGKSAGISRTMSPVFDTGGNLYFTDMDNNCIRQLTPGAGN